MWGSLAAFALLAACETVAPVAPALPPEPRPAALALPVPAPAAPTSERSAALRRYLAQVQSSQLTSGLLRQDGGGPDTPFSADMLARNFERIVFFNEYSATGASRGGTSDLRRWSGPVRIGVEFGPSVPPSQRLRDRADVRAYAARLARATGHPVSTAGPPNFLASAPGPVASGFAERADMRMGAALTPSQVGAATLDALAPRLPGVSQANLAALRNLPQDAYCAVAAYASGPDRNTYTAAVAVIRAENPDLLRLSCIHEELAQALGLANDSPDARPSIFNDDDEFALLTDHDEALLGMLYDKRLKPGMSLAEARPIVRMLAIERTGGPS